MMQGLPGIPIDDEPPKRWPWWLAWIRPHAGSKKTDYIVRCTCGRVMWLHSSSAIKKHHMGPQHKHEVIESGSIIEFIKMKTGLLKYRTLGEVFKDFMEGKQL